MTELLGICITILFIYWILVKIRGNSKLPPGPFGLPIVGYLPFLDSKNPQKSMQELAFKYGDIFSLQMGQLFCVVLSDQELIKTLFSKLECSGRAPLYLTHGIMNGFGLICAQGERWKVQRKFTLDFMRKFGMSKFNPTATPKIENKIRTCIDEFFIELDGRQILHSELLDSLLSHTVGNMMNEILFGIHYPSSDKNWQHIQQLRQRGIKEMQVATPVNFLPWLRYIFPRFGRTRDWMVQGKHETHQEYAKIVEEFSQNTEDCIVSFFYKEKERLHQSKSPYLEYYSDEQLHHLIADLFGAGLDTTLTTLKWALLYLATYQDTQDMVRQEIQSIDNFFNAEDKIPKTTSVLLEIQRMCPVVPLGVPHGTLEDVESLGKWIIPKGSMLMVNHWSLNYNPANYENPKTFRPLRFLESNEIMKPMPFQVGRRKCVGEDFGKAMVLALVSSFLKKYYLKLEQAYNFTEEPPVAFTRAPNDFTLILDPIF